MDDQQKQLSSFLNHIAKEVDSIIIDRANMAVFRERIRPFAERWKSSDAAFKRFEDERVNHWQRVKADPRLQDKAAGPPEEGWNWTPEVISTTWCQDLNMKCPPSMDCP